MFYILLRRAYGRAGQVANRRASLARCATDLIPEREWPRLSQGVPRAGWSQAWRCCRWRRKPTPPVASPNSGRGAGSTSTSRSPCSSIATGCCGSDRARACSATTATRRRRSCPTRTARAASATRTFAHCTKSDDGALWVSTNTGGLNRRDPRTGKFTQFHHDSSNPRSLSDESIYGVAEDADGRIWVGTQNGLNRLDADGRSFVRYFHESGDANSLAHNWAYALHRGRVAAAVDRHGRRRHRPVGRRGRQVRAFPARAAGRRRPRARRRVCNSRGRRWPGVGRHTRRAGRARPRASHGNAHRHGERRGDAAAHHDDACGSLRATMDRDAGARRAGRRPRDAASGRARILAASAPRATCRRSRS